MGMPSLSPLSALDQTHCPKNEDISSSVIITWSVWYSACAKVLCFTITNKHGRSTETNVMSSTAFCRRQFCQLREKKMEKVERKRKTDRDFYDVGVIEVDTTRKQLKIHFAGFSHEYDEWRDYDNERNCFPFVRLEKMFFPAEGPLEARGNIFPGRLYGCIRRKLWSGRKDDPEVRIELNVEPLKWYKLKSGGINRKNEELFNIRKFRNRTV